MSVSVCVLERAKHSFFTLLDPFCELSQIKYVSTKCHKNLCIQYIKKLLHRTKTDFQTLINLAIKTKILKYKKVNKLTVCILDTANESKNTRYINII